MKIHIKAFVITVSILWGGAVFLVGISNLIWSDYGNLFLQVVASIYPGYKATGTFGDVIIGTLYALIDGAIGSFIFGWLYNMIAGKNNTE